MRATLCLVARIVVGVSLSFGLLANPGVRGHSHNDYEQPRPLFDALDAGITDIEVDIFRVGD